MTYTCGMPRQRTGTDFVSCTELMQKQANTTSAFNGSYPSHFCIQNYHSALASNFFPIFTPQSTNLFFWKQFVVAIATIKETRMNFMLLFDRSSSKHNFNLVLMIIFFCSKRYVAKESFWKLFSNEKPYLPCYLLYLAK